MIHLPKRETKLLVAIHGWSGIVLGLLLYAVVLTGMVAVFAHEIGTWSAGVTETRSPFTRAIDAPLRALTERTPKQFRESVSLFPGPGNDMGYFFHRHDVSPSGEAFESGYYYETDAAGRVTEQRQGTSEEIFGATNRNALEHFLVDTHVRLHVPDPWGLLLTGILGLAMLVAAVSGLLIHRHLFKDIFTLRRRARPVLAARDMHSVAGTWSLPFAFLLAFTGSFFSFAGTVGLPAIAMVAFGGDQVKANETVFGAAGAADARPRLSGNLDRAVADSIRRAGHEPDFVSVENLDRADATIVTFHQPREGGLEPLNFVYDGTTGAFREQKPSIGRKPSAGGSFFAIMFPLHVGNFAGLLSKAVWLGLGFAMCFVTLTGMRLWLRRRAEERAGLAALDRLVSVIGFGLPLALAAAALGYFLALPAGGATYWTPAAFLIASALAIATGFVVRDAAALARVIGLATGALLVALPAVRLLTGGPGWGAALDTGQPIIVALDIGVVISGIALIRSLWPTRGVSAATARPVLQPAE